MCDLSVARSVLPSLSHVLQSGVKTFIWGGDADWICNWIGTLRVAERIKHDAQKAFQNATAQNYTVDGKTVGEVRSAGNLTWFLQKGAGHAFSGPGKLPLFLFLSNSEICSHSDRPISGGETCIFADDGEQYAHVHMRWVGVVGAQTCSQMGVIRCSIDESSNTQ